MLAFSLACVSEEVFGEECHHPAFSGASWLATFLASRLSTLGRVRTSM